MRRKEYLMRKEKKVEDDNKNVEEFKKIIKNVDKSSMKDVELFDANYVYNIKKIISLIYDEIGKSSLLNSLDEIDNSCCPTDVSEYVSYDDYFNKVEKFKELMNKTYVFNKYDNGIIRYGSVSRLLTLSDGDFIDLIMTKSGFVLNDPEEKVKYVIEYLLEEINNTDLKKFRINESDINKMSNDLFNRLKSKTKLGGKINFEEEKKKLLGTLRDNYLQTKNFITSYVRKNLWIIKNDFKPPIEKLDFTNSETSKEMQKFIGMVNAPILEFLKSSSSFSKINLEYRIGYLDNLMKNVSNMSDRKFEEIHQVVIYIILTELYKLSVDGDYIVNNFIMTIIQIFNKDISQLRLIKNEFDTFLKKYEISRRKEMLGVIKAGDLIDEFDVEPDILDLEDDQISRDALTEKYKQEYLEEYGKAPNEDEVESYLEDFYQEIEIDKEVEQENFLTIQPHETNENMSMGDDYGEMPQGVESTGDGFSEVTDDYDIST